MLETIPNTMSKAAGRASPQKGSPGRNPAAILKSENGDVNYFSTVVFIFIAVLLLAFILDLFSIISTKQELDHCADQMVKQIQLSGGVNGETEQLFNFLCSQIEGAENISYSIDASYKSPTPSGMSRAMVDMQEMVIWSCLNWRIARMEEIGRLYTAALPVQKDIVSRSWKDCVERLLTRGLLVCGKGETEYDALYDLLSSMYIIPTDGSALLRMLSFLKLTLVNHVPFSSARKLFRRDQRTENEKQVMALARQALLSTAELIRCMEKDIRSLPTEESILEGLYDDADTTSDNISCMMRLSSESQAVTLAVANLYLRQQIIFERI